MVVLLYLNKAREIKLYGVFKPCAAFLFSKKKNLNEFISIAFIMHISFPKAKNKVLAKNT